MIPHENTTNVVESMHRSLGKIIAPMNIRIVLYWKWYMNDDFCLVYYFSFASVWPLWRKGNGNEFGKLELSR